MKFRTPATSKPKTLLPANFSHAGVDSGRKARIANPVRDQRFGDIRMSIGRLEADGYLSEFQWKPRRIQDNTGIPTGFGRSSEANWIST